MTSYAWDIPGYMQGHRFSQDAEFYDSANTRFRDLAGYDHLANYCEKTAGTAAFSNHGANSREGLLLNNSNQWRFIPAIPWDGTVLVVIKPTLVSAAVTHYPWLFSKSATATTNGNIRLVRASSVNSLQCLTTGASLSRSVTGLVSGNICIVAFSLNQEDRKIHSTQDGVTVTSTSAAAGTTNGNAVAIGYGTSSDPDARYGRLGNLDNSTTTANATDYLHVFEQHFWKGDVLNDNATKLQAFITTLKAYYGI
jgi:hypothetical protein